MLIVYGGLSFGLAMSTKSLVTEAAAEGARAAVGGTTCAAYQSTASTQALQALKGLSGSNWASITPTVGNINGGACVDGGTGNLVTVTVTYPYADHPTIPSAPGLGLVLPTSVGAVYTVEVS
jgi:Flp pilus assembly protein TadG